MKRGLMGLFGCLLATSAMAQGPVYSVNTVGFNKITLERNKLYLIATAFEDINGNSLYANDVFGTQVPAGTAINFYDGVADPSPYTTVTRAAFGANNGWPTNLAFQGFMGFWIKIPAAAANPSYDVVLKGQVPMDNTTSNIVVSGLNMLGYPYTADVAFSNTALFASAQTGDQLNLWNPSTTNYTQFTKPGFGTWVAGAQILRQGQGFWFKRAAGTPVLDTEARPYPTN
jgi:hypothetical protein